nr:reverse transcriptase domain-containing protein [Tanacetum cinerariifolium]
MRTRRSYFPPANTIPRHSRRKNTSFVESDIQTNATMVDNRTMAQMLQAPIEGYEDAIVVPPINANNFELKQTLINLVQYNQFTGRQDPHNHLRFFNKVTSTFRHPEVPNTTVKLLLFPFSLEGEARIWLDKEPPRSILTWKDLVSKFINQFFPRPKQRGSASSTTHLTPIATPTPTTTVVAAPRLSAAAKELSWNSSYDEDVDDQTKGRDDTEGEKTAESDDDDDQDEAAKVNDDDDDEEEISKIGEQEATESDEGDDEATESDRESEDKDTREQEEESFDPIPRTPEESEDDDNNKEDQGLRIGEEERMHEEEEADELYRDVDINQGRGLQVSQVIEDSHVTLTLTHSDGQQESSSTSSFMTNLLNPTMDPDRVKSLEDKFSNIPGIVHQYMHQQMPEAVRKAVQVQTDQLQDSIQRENNEFLKTIDDNMKKIIKEQVKTQVKAQVIIILPRIEESVNAQLEAEVLTRSSHSSKTLYVVAADLSEMELKKILIKKMEGNKSIQ